MVVRQQRRGLAFISYAQDDAAHVGRVVDLATRLKASGLDVALDRWVEVGPPEGWPLWCERMMTEAAVVIVVGSPAYLRRYQGTEDPGEGLGASWEAHLLRLELVESRGRLTRFLFVYWDGADVRNELPLAFRGHTRFPLWSDYPGLERAAHQLARAPDALLEAPGSIPGASTWPPSPAMLVGRERDLQHVTESLLSQGTTGGRIGIRGLPGVGKTSLLSALPSLPEIEDGYPDGIAWLALGPHASTSAKISNLAGPFAIPELRRAATPEETTSILRRALHDKRVLVILDDVWSLDGVAPFLGTNVNVVVSTRDQRLARDVGGTKEPILLDVLTAEASIEVMRRLAPAVVRDHHDEVATLVETLGRLPLALQVAGRMLRDESAYGWGLEELLRALEDPSRVLGERAPLDTGRDEGTSTPSVDALLARSTQHLDAVTIQRFELLGTLVAKPAVFDLEDVQALWEIDDPRPTLRELVDRGLVEAVGGGRFQVHALIMAHARRGRIRGNR